MQVVMNGDLPAERWGQVYRGHFYPWDDLERIGVRIGVHIGYKGWKTRAYKRLMKAPTRIRNKRWSSLNYFRTIKPHDTRKALS
jgi:hypothetical protein